MSDRRFAFFRRPGVVVRLFPDPFDPTEGDWLEPQVARLWLQHEQVVLLDAVDAAWAAQWRWSLHLDQRGHAYVRREQGPRTARRPVYLHREICERAHGPSPAGKPMVDHVNGNGCDNRRENLRWSSRRDNALNTAATRASAFLDRAAWQVVTKISA